VFRGVYKGRRVLVTGHTGFKGSWLALWLTELGATVAGYSDRIPTTPAHFGVLDLEKRVEHHFGDVRDLAALRRVVDRFQPEMIFHLAAQPIVRVSYAEPAATFETNVMGTVNVLEAARNAPSVRAVVLITSDKCYRNVEWVWGYRENDALGGHDPYSGSKGAAELAAYSYFHSFFNKPDAAAMATARAGNVIGGGDWAADRIVPDCVRAWAKGETVTVRSPHATRPWQHVLEPLSGYLALGEALWRRHAPAVGSAYNFGPEATVTQSVGELIDSLVGHWPGAAWKIEGQDQSRPEARLLKLSCDKALAELDWRAVLTFDECMKMTGEWYREYYGPSATAATTEAAARSVAQVAAYASLAKARGLAWAQK
jgi:CDP-glucose 4,6-dehydratase